MKLLILSDLHMSNGDSFGVFGWDQNDFIAQIEIVRMLYAIDTVVLNGDIFELAKYTPGEIESYNQRLIGYLKEIDAVFIKGNHDCTAEGIDSYSLINGKGETIYIEHGHKADLIDGNPVGRTVSHSFFKILKRCIRYSIVKKWYMGVLAREEGLRGTQSYYLNNLRYAFQLLKKYDTIILGHTHKIETHTYYHQNNRKIYLNSGSCSLGRLQGIVLDTETLQFELINREAVKNHPPTFNQPAPMYCYTEPVSDL